MLVKEVMTPNVITVSPDTPLREVGKILKERKISGVPVVADDQSLVGIITLTDMIKMLQRIYEWKEFEKRDSEPKLSEKFEQEKSAAKVKDVMTCDVVTLGEEDTMDDVMQLMFQKGIHTLPVMRGSDIVGIIGKRDVIHFCF